MTNGRKACMSGDRCDGKTLADVLYCAVHHGEDEASTVAERIGVRRGYLLDAANPDREDTQFQARLIVPLTKATGNYKLIKFLANECGGVFFPLPEVNAPDHGDIVKQTTTVVGEFGDVLADLRTALSDGRLTPDEAMRVSVQAYEAIAEIASLAVLLRAKAEAPELHKERV